MTRLKETYQNEIVKGMTDKFGYKNVMQVPKILIKSRIADVDTVGTPDRQSAFACQRSNRKGHGDAVIQKTVKNGSLQRFASIYDHAIFGSCDITSHFT